MNPVLDDLVNILHDSRDKLKKKFQVVAEELHHEFLGASWEVHGPGEACILQCQFFQLRIGFNKLLGERLDDSLDQRLVLFLQVRRVNYETHLEALISWEIISDGVNFSS